LKVLMMNLCHFATLKRLNEANAGDAS
jgi:hypothetical protein